MDLETLEVVPVMSTTGIEKVRQLIEQMDRLRYELVDASSEAQVIGTRSASQDTALSLAVDEARNILNRKLLELVPPRRRPGGPDAP